MGGVPCVCGHSLNDNTDLIEYKAGFISEPDYADWRGSGHANSESGWDLLRDFYQCNRCDRIIIVTPDGEFASFYPETGRNRKNILASVRGND